MFGIDYSFSRPNIRCLKERQVGYAVRYLSGGRSEKDLTVTEIDELRANDIDIVTVWQTTAGFMISGYNTGRYTAERAREQAYHLGQPNNRPIYYALDVDPNNLKPSSWHAIREFIRGAMSFDGTWNVGIYGGYEAINRLHGLVHYCWQTYGWSTNRLHPNTNLYQFLNEVNYCNGQVDFNDSKTPDFGQWGFKPVKETEEKEPEDDMRHLVAYEDWQPGEPVFMTDFAQKVEIRHGSDHHELLRFFKIAAGESPDAIRIPRKALDQIPYA